MAHNQAHRTFHALTYLPDHPARALATHDQRLTHGPPTRARQGTAVLLENRFKNIRLKNYASTPWSFTLGGVGLTRGQGERDQVCVYIYVCVLCVVCVCVCVCCVCVCVCASVCVCVCV
jgi:hypothetical protein